MSSPSDLPPIAETLKIWFSYFIGAISLIVNTVTLIIIIRKGSTLDREVKVLTVFLQVTCMMQNVFNNMLFLPFSYPVTGGLYCTGLICSAIPIKLLTIVYLFLNTLMIAAFGMLIIARHQLILQEGSMISFGLRTRIGACLALYVILFLSFESLTIMMIFLLQTDRKVQNAVLDKFPQLKWRERGLIWTVIDFREQPNFMFIYCAVMSALVLIGGVHIFVPFSHMFTIVLRAGRRIHAQKSDKTNVRHAKSVVIQFLVLLFFLLVPFLLVGVVSNRDNVYADTQVLMAVAESIFACATLANSYVVITRNRRYMSALTSFYNAVRHRERAESVSVSMLFVPRAK